MPVPTQIQEEKNIWVAAGDGDLERVRVSHSRHRHPHDHLTSRAATRRTTVHVAFHPRLSFDLKDNITAISPNAPDPFTYTPMHAAASYAQLEVLAYLVQQGGDVNITDEDGDTPLYTVETIETAQWLIDHGAVIDRRNGEGVSPIEHLQEDSPEVAAFLQSKLNPSAVSQSSDIPAEPQPSQYSQNAASETLTSNLMQTVNDIMQRAEAEGTDPDEELRQAVSRTVLEGVLTGYEMSTQDGADTPSADDENSKRHRMNGSHDG